MMSMFDDPRHRKPANRTAGIVTAAGTHHEPTCKIANEHSDLPLPTRPVPEGMRDLTGRKQGRLTVIGLSLKPRKTGKGTRWVVRCSCGCYEERGAKAILNEANSKDCCVICRTLAQRRRHHDYITTGKDRNIEDYL